MPIVTKYVCDRCQHTQDTDDQMWNLGIYLSGARSYYHSMHTPPTRAALWCRACVETIGLLPGEKPADPAPAPPTFEDMIRAIVREEVQ